MNLKKLLVLAASVITISAMSGCSSPKLFPWDDGFLSPPPAAGAKESNRLDLAVNKENTNLNGSGLEGAGTGPGPFQDPNGPLAGGNPNDPFGDGVGVRWKDGIVYFGFDQSNIAETEYPKVNSLVEQLKANPQQLVLIEGHCDSRGGDEYNRGLGERRANSIRDYMVTAGIAADRIQTISFGEEKPAVPNPTSEEEYAKNRRGEFVIGKK